MGLTGLLGELAIVGREGSFMGMTGCAVEEESPLGVGLGVLICR